MRSISTTQYLLWAASPQRRQALLHAVSIQDIAERLPIGRAYAPHVSTSVFAAASVYHAFIRAGMSNVHVPLTVDWHSTVSLPDVEVGSTRSSCTEAYTQGQNLSDEEATCKSLIYSLNTLQAILHMSGQWGVCHEMLDIIRVWLTAK